jgi:toxin ParE1/3/4
MALLVHWALDALDDLENIVSYIEQYSLRAAQQLEHDIVHSVEQLPYHPYLYRIGRISDTREMVVHPNYLVIYQVEAQRISILNVLHARQDYP